MTAPDNMQARATAKALQSFAREALGYCRQNYGLVRIGPSESFERWHRNGPEYFIANPDQGWLREPLEVMRDRQAYAGMPAMEAVRTAFQDERWLAEQYGATVGTCVGRRHVDMAGVLDAWLIAPLVTSAGSFDVEEVALTAQAASVLAAFDAADLPHSFLVPLLGFTASDAFALEEDLTVRPLSDDEIDRCLLMGALPMTAESLTARRIRPQNQWCVALDTRLPKLVGDPGSASARQYEERVVAEADMFVAATRTVVGGAVTRGARVSTAPVSLFNPQRGGSFEYRDVVPPWHSIPARLSGPDAAVVVDVYRSLRDGFAKDKAVGVAVRRLVDAGTRAFDVDALVDLVVALEALFASDTGQSGEITLRVSLRVALLVHLEGRRPSEVRRFIAAAYGARSKLVHGSEVKAFKNLAGEPSTVHEVAQDLERIVRTAVLRVLTESPAVTGYRHWDEVLDRQLDRE